tara:strand:- start:84 stop:458 length:375 start_codon:yes stop_codon:yes gene_type:complete
MKIVKINNQEVRVTKTATRDYLKEQLAVNDKWIKKALIEILSNQTDDEVTNECTSNLNGIGFTGADAEILTSFAKQLMRRGYLSTKQMEITRRKMPKYWKQIMGICDPNKLDKLVAKSLISIVA